MYPQAVLSFTLPNGEKRAVALRPNEPVLIGRNRASTIKLNLPSVSRQHARIIFERDVFWIEDLGSSNGTFVNQKQVQKARINIGDVLKCGDFVIAVRNHSDRTSIPPITHSQDELKPSDPPLLDRRVTMGQRRDSLGPSQQPTGALNVNPWHSKAPTHGPEESITGPQSGAAKSVQGRISREPRRSAPPSASPRTEGLSTAYSDTKFRETERQRLKSDRPASSPMRPSGGSNLNMQTSEEDTTELMRLRIVEQQLLDEVNFQTTQIETLQRELQEANERIVNLSSELDHGAQQFDKLRQSLENVDRESDEALKKAHNEVEALKSENQSIQQEIYTVKEQNRTERSDLVGEIKSLERENQSLKDELDRALDNAARALDNSAHVEKSDELDSLIKENTHLKSVLEQRQGATEVHVFSLPRPHQEATDPDWAKVQSKYQQMVEELRSLRSEVLHLKNEANHQEIVSPSDTHKSNSLLDRVHKEQSTEKSQAMVERERSMAVNKQATSADMSPAGETHATSSANTRRAWRGML